MVLTKNLNAQYVRLEVLNKAPFPVMMKSVERKIVLNKVDSLIDLYAKWGGIFDPKKKKVTDEAASNFYRLFTLNARLTKDYEENIPTDFVDAKTYANAIFSFLVEQGFQFKIEKAYLESVIEDKDFYIASVNIEKTKYTMIDGRRKPKSTTGRFMEQRFRIDIPKKDFSKLKISEISRICKGKECLPADAYARYIGVSGGVKMGVLGAAPSTYFRDSHTVSSLKIRQDLSWSVGADWVSNNYLKSSATKKKLFLAAGFRFGQDVISSKLSNYTINAFQAEAIDPKITNPKDKQYIRAISNLDMVEKATFTNISLPIGASLRLIHKSQLNFFIDVRAVPILVLKGVNLIDGAGTFNGFLPVSFTTNGPKDGRGFSLLRKSAVNPADGYAIILDPNKVKPFDVGGKVEISDTKPLVDVNRQISYSDRTNYYDGSRVMKSSDFGFQKFVVAARLSPTVYYDFSTNDTSWGAMLGLDIDYQFTSYFNHNPVTNFSREPLKYQYDYKGSLPQHFSEKMNALNVGIRVGIYQKLQRQP